MLRRELTRAIEHAIAHRSLDARHIDRLRRLDAKHGLELSAPLEPWRPDVGESYVLTHCESSAGVERLVAKRAGRPFAVAAEGFGEKARLQIELAHAALLAALRGSRRRVPDERGHGHVMSASCETVIDGASLGVAAAIALSSRWLGRAPDPTVAATARVDARGRLGGVNHLFEKLAALQEAQPRVRRVIIAPDQDVPTCMPPGVTLVRVETLTEALREVGLDLRQLAEAPMTAAARDGEWVEFKHAREENYETKR